MADFKGKFVWHELMTSDPKAAATFYASVIGWNVQDAGLPGQDYRVLLASETMVGGLMALPPGAGDRSLWNGYVAVQDVDGTAKQIVAAGGTLMKGPADIPTIGRFAVVTDPQGACFLLFRGDGEPPAALPAQGAAGTFGWNELMTTDITAAFAFYSKFFGWTKDQEVDMGPMGIYQTFITGDGPAAGGMMKKTADMPHSYWRFYVNVEAADAAAARIKKAGGRVTQGPSPVPGGSWIVNAIDPQGAEFAVVAPTR